MLIANISSEKPTRDATTMLIIVPIKVPVGLAERTNIAIKKGMKRGATSKLIVLYEYPYIYLK